jgi:hypothetical protein
MHILMGVTLSPLEAAKRVWYTKPFPATRSTAPWRSRGGSQPTRRNGASHQAARPQRAGTPLDQGLPLERNLFMDLCGSDEAIARMNAYESRRITSPSRTLKI